MVGTAIHDINTVLSTFTSFGIFNNKNFLQKLLPPGRE